MKLNADILHDNLCQYAKIESHGKRQREILFGRPEFFTGQSWEFESGHLYVSLADKLPRNPFLSRDVLLVCLGGNPPAAYLNEQNVCFVVKDKTDLLTVFNFLTDIYNKYDEWEKKLEDVIEHSGDITELVELGEQFLEAPVMILDSRFRYLAYSDCIDSRAELADYRPDPHGSVVPDKLSSLLKTYGTSMSVREPIYTTLLHDMISVNLFDGEETIGSVTAIFVDRSRRGGDLTLVEFFARKIEKLQKRYHVLRHTRKDTLKDIIQNLLHCYPVDAGLWQKTKTADREGTFLCIKIIMKNPSRKVPFEYICNGFEENLPETIAVVYEDSIIAIVNVDQLKKGMETLEEYMKALLDSVDLTAGISIPYPDFEMTRTYYRQASIAIELGQEEAPENNFYLFRTYALSYMLKHCGGEFSDDMLHCRGLDQLIRHDRMSNVEYLLTLRTYLNNNMNVTRTAGDLNIHKTSLLARLKRIKGMLDVDLDNPDERLQLLINLRKLG